MSNENKDLKDYFNEANGASDKDAAKNMKKKDNKVNKTPIIISIVVLVILIIGVIFLIPKIKEINDNDSSSKKNGSGEEQTLSKKDLAKLKKEEEEEKARIENMTEDEINKLDEETLKGDLEKNKTPIKVESWADAPFDSNLVNKDKVMDGAEEYADNLGVNNAFGLLPSEELGYTSDVNKVENADGTLNPWYSYQTKENMEYVFSTYTQRLINPIYGNWYMLPIGQPGQVEASFNEATFKDMFTEDWWNKNIDANNHKQIPIMADWNGDNFGGLDLKDTGKGVFFGEIKSTNVEMEDAQSGNGVNLLITSDVEYVAFDKKNKKIKKNGELFIKLVPNEESTDITHRALIDDAQLTLK